METLEVQSTKQVVAGLQDDPCKRFPTGQAGVFGLARGLYSQLYVNYTDLKFDIAT